jgi:ribonucleotide monophosphatase NagD (HAD superfamily)
MEPPCRKAFVIGSPALVSEMEARGITCVTEAGGDVSSEAAFAGLELDAGVEVVVSGWDPYLTWSKLAVASAYLQVVGSWTRNALSIVTLYSTCTVVCR